MVELAGDIIRWNISIVRPSILPDRGDNVGNILTSDRGCEASVLLSCKDNYQHMTVLEIKLINRQIERERLKGCLAAYYYFIKGKYFSNWLKSFQQKKKIIKNDVNYIHYI